MQYAIAPKTGESQMSPTQPIVLRVSRFTRIAWAEATRLMATIDVPSTCGQSMSHQRQRVSGEVSISIKFCERHYCAMRRMTMAVRSSACGVPPEKSTTA